MNSETSSNGTDRECPDCGGDMTEVNPHGEQRRWTCRDCPRVVNNPREFRPTDTDTEQGDGT